MSAEVKHTGWQPMSSAPKDGALILYANKYREIGHCYWSEAGSVFDESMWFDDVWDQEVFPKWWLPGDTLPEFPSEATAA